jgi:hypothetical protein
MDTTYQDDGMLKAFGLVYTLLRNDVPVQWVIRPGKAHLGVDFTTSAVDHKTQAVITAHGYRGGPWVIDAANAAKAMPIINAWQVTNPDVAVHEVTAPFWGDVARRLIVAPTIAMHQDGNEKIARGYLQAAGIPDSTLDPAWPVTARHADACRGGRATTTNHHDGKLSMPTAIPSLPVHVAHWGVNGRRTVLKPWSGSRVPKHPVHFRRGQAVNVFEGVLPLEAAATSDHAGPVWPAPNQPKRTTFHDDSSFAQLDGVSSRSAAASPLIHSPPGSFRRGRGHDHESGTPEGDYDVWMSGFLDGACPPDTENCSNNYGKVSYLGGHQYSTYLPISKNPTTQGTRLFLDSLFEAPCATASGQPQISVQKLAPSNTGSPTVTFTINYQNAGPGVARAAALSDRFRQARASCPQVRGMSCPVER